MASVQPQEIEAVRRFNRGYTRRIGVLHAGLLDSPYSLTEVRVLYELANRPKVGASELAADLDLDRGYLSRILKRFEADGLLARATSSDDGRRHHLRLTPAGLRTFAPLDRRSQEQVQGMIGALAPERRSQLLAAMRTIESILEPGVHAAGDVVLRAPRPGDYGWVVQRHGELYFQEYGYDQRFEAIVADIVARFVQGLDPARERAWIAERDGERLGSVFLVATDEPGVAKLRLLLLEPHARGLGLGRRLVDTCVAFAREAGYTKVTLWTQSELDAARHIYARVGFRKCEERRHRDFSDDEKVAEIWELSLAKPGPGEG
jgi:DNA-binding MarR family transcriptional regulator/GNAT superfamily N-acetyltransferase